MVHHCILLNTELPYIDLLFYMTTRSRSPITQFRERRFQVYLPVSKDRIHSV